ncbi:hypothetical protein ACFYVL_17785 [Streptomyces sp. NPDC004111]|uniref:hypothetical protein n=1 Tax=Streptomyces sp. NPDC004111 TaxID=3364690 RepID=UPI003677D976
MIIEQGLPAHAVCLDLRSVAAPGAEPGAATRAVREALAAVRSSADARRRFLVVDHAARLDRNQLLYEQLFAHGSARIVCLAIGPAEEDRQDHAAPPVPGPRDPGGATGLTGPRGHAAHRGRVSAPPAATRPLARPLSLRPPDAGVLWILDALAGEASAAGSRAAAPQDAAGDDDVLRPLLEVLSEPRVFDAVLQALGKVTDGVAVPGVRILEHDLTEAARRRIWRQALDTLAGQDVPAPALVTAASPADHTGYADEPAAGPPEAVPSELSPLLGGGIPRSIRDRAWLVHGGDAELRHRRCESALRDAEGAYEQTRPVSGLLTSARRQADIPGALAELSAALLGYREAIAGALTDGDGLRLMPEQRSRLNRRGIELPEIAEVSRESVGPGLRGYTEQLLAKGLPLRSVAARLGGLSDQSAPVGSAARLTELDRACPSGYARDLATPAPFVVGGDRPRAVDLTVALVLAFAAGLWPSLGWLIGPLAGIAMAVPALLMMSRRPSRSPDRRLDGGGESGWFGRLAAGVAGGVAGGLVGQLSSVPPWLGACALLLALALSFALSARDWTRAVDAWWTEMRVRDAARCVDDIDRLLAETAVHDWLFADARYHCSDGARAIAVLLRRIAGQVESYQPPQRPARPAPQPATGTGANVGYEYESSHHDDFGAEEPPREDDEPEPGEHTGSDPATQVWSWDSWSDAVETEPAGNALDDLFASDRNPAPDHTSPFPTDTFRTDPPHPRETPAEEWEPAETAGPPWLERETGDGGTALVPTLVSDLTHGVTLLLASCWATVERDPDAASRLPLAPRVGELLDQEHTALRRDAVAAPPPFAPDPENRPGAAMLLGVPIDRTAEMLDSDSFAERALRLCAAEHRRMLSKDPEAERRVHFAPEAARRGAESADPDGWHGTADDVVWTPGGRHAGVLSLVPLRSGGVRTVRSYDDPEPEGDDA